MCIRYTRLKSTMALRIIPKNLNCTYYEDTDFKVLYFIAFKSIFRIFAGNKKIGKSVTELVMTQQILIYAELIVET